MIVGIPKEIKRDEYRVAMLPVGVEEMVRAGNTVLVEAGAGLGSGLPDHDYLRAGAELVPAAAGSAAAATTAGAEAILGTHCGEEQEDPLRRAAGRHVEGVDLLELRHPVADFLADTQRGQE